MNIDYKKLKIAHELADKLTKHQAGTYFNMGKLGIGTEREFYAVHSTADYSDWVSFQSIDPFIEKLKELIQEQTANDLPINTKLVDMNNFTKEELEYIIHLCHICNSYHSSPSQNFKNKIQSMIDDYSECNHKEIITGAYPRSDPPKKCDACGELYR